MRKNSLTKLFLILFSGCFLQTRGQSEGGSLLKPDDFLFLKSMTRDVLENSKVCPGQKITADSIPNNTGGLLIRPGGRDCYPAFWIRDYAMALESGFVTAAEQKHMLLLTASTQCDQTWITKNGSIVPFGAVADHIRIDDGLPVYFPGTYNVKEQGNKTFGMFPPYCDQFYFIDMAYWYLKSTSDIQVLKDEIKGMPLITRLEIAFKIPPERQGSHIVYTTDDYRGVDFGFRDVIKITGDLCFPSLLKFRAANEMAEMMEMLGNSNKANEYRIIAEQIKSAVPRLFLDQRGMLLASTGKSGQPDVWSTAYAVYLNVLDGEKALKSCHFLSDAYTKGTLSYKGNIRHILTSDDFNGSTAWESSLVEKNRYQNGAYWATPAGWVCYAISRVDLIKAGNLATDYIKDLRENDYRKGADFGAPYECFHPSGFKQNPVYLASVACPYIVFNELQGLPAR